MVEISNSKAIKQTILPIIPKSKIRIPNLGWEINERLCNSRKIGKNQFIVIGGQPLIFYPLVPMAMSGFLFQIFNALGQLTEKLG